jgi:hypothetical protein
VKQPGDADESNEGDEMWDEEPGILEESKTWNELYAAHRPENRLQNIPCGPYKSTQKHVCAVNEIKETICLRLYDK